MKCLQSQRHLEVKDERRKKLTGRNDMTVPGSRATREDTPGHGKKHPWLTGRRTPYAVFVAPRDWYHLHRKLTISSHTRAMKTCSGMRATGKAFANRVTAARRLKNAGSAKTRRPGSSCMNYQTYGGGGQIFLPFSLLTAPPAFFLRIHIRISRISNG